MHRLAQRQPVGVHAQDGPLGDLQRQFGALRGRSRQLVLFGAEIAQAEGVDVTQVRRLLRLTLLAPEVLERLTESPTAVLEHVMRQPWPNGWSDQMRVLAPPA